MLLKYTRLLFFFFFFNDTATTEIYTLSLHDALPILRLLSMRATIPLRVALAKWASVSFRSEEHTSELQSPCNLVCRLLLEKKKKNDFIYISALRHIQLHEILLRHKPTAFY